MTILEEMAQQVRAGVISQESFIQGALAVEKTQHLMQRYLESYRKLILGNRQGDG